ncbi:hypothetical protein [Corallincola spongiicola]|uniref:Uncharacterized protein n=1 Tax=Corallincola spongiicola TaxID=2520508 RepID=A0ABY1WU87_9GAMM|nr:hypothetical protein [Corallincola spongiicola]TAA48298.1 hypothetical protein EXY25_03435 [Corallincola spongiicola]
MKKYKQVILISVVWALSLISVSWLFGIGGYALGTAESITTSQVTLNSSTANARALTLAAFHMEESERSDSIVLLEDMLIREIESYYSFKDQLAWYTPKLERFHLFSPIQSSEGKMRIVAKYVHNYIGQDQISENEALQRLMDEYPNTR